MGMRPAAFSSVIGFGDTHRRDTRVDPTPRTNQTPVGGGKRSPGRWQPDRVVGRQTGCWGRQTGTLTKISRLLLKYFLDFHKMLFLDLDNTTVGDHDIVCNAICKSLTVHALPPPVLV